ncbi:hypothetical protein [Novosphingobium beihaiensis]|uniref:Uncharacterized protein n=1 Tax=Novosphingobium beihaiensis TaxID=2930389 RepID=A0ABT0BVQ8_9SPHN|nr:hypothetical protein [Novosphingobium beihaiensis]MCJ2189170.1 hypothetical protein [Novosphingobium beihaiensis]
MPIPAEQLQAYKDARDGLVITLSMAEKAFTDADFSYDPTSDYRTALGLINATLLQLRALAVNTLKAIDDAIANSNMVAELNAKADAAKKEAEALTKVAHRIDEIAGILAKVTAVVTGIAGLPFL